MKYGSVKPGAYEMAYSKKKSYGKGKKKTKSEKYGKDTNVVTSRAKSTSCGASVSSISLAASGSISD